VKFPCSEDKNDIPGLDEARGPLLVPPLLMLQAIRGIELNIALSSLAGNDNTDTPSIEVPCCKGADTTQGTGTKVDRMGRSFGEGSCLGPMDVLRVNLITERPRDRLRRGTHVIPCVTARVNKSHSFARR
jgi:hypothetical protein